MMISKEKRSAWEIEHAQDISAIQYVLNDSRGRMFFCYLMTRTSYVDADASVATHNLYMHMFNELIRVSPKQGKRVFNYGLVLSNRFDGEIIDAFEWMACDSSGIRVCAWLLKKMNFGRTCQNEAELEEIRFLFDGFKKVTPGTFIQLTDFLFERRFALEKATEQEDKEDEMELV